MVLRPSRSCQTSISISEYPSRSCSTHLVNLSDVLQGIDLVNFSLQLARLEEAEQLIGVVFELLTSLNVAKESRASNLDTLGRQFPVKDQSASYSTHIKRRITYGRGIGGTGPLALPNQTIVPLRLTASKLPSHVSLPTES